MSFFSSISSCKIIIGLQNPFKVGELQKKKFHGRMYFGWKIQLKLESFMWSWNKSKSLLIISSFDHVLMGAHDLLVQQSPRGAHATMKYTFCAWLNKYLLLAKLGFKLHSLYSKTIKFWRRGQMWKKRSNTVWLRIDVWTESGKQGSGGENLPICCLGRQLGEVREEF